MTALAAVTGLGAVSPFGNGVHALWDATLAGSSSSREGVLAIPETALAEGARAVEDTCQSLTLTPSQHFRLTHSAALAPALLALREACQQAGWGGLRPGDGLVIGTTAGQARYWEAATMDFLAGKGESAFAARYPGQPLGTLLSDLRLLLQHEGPSLTLASACAASTQAIALGAQWVASGKVERCLVGGVELLCELTTSGFRALRLLSPEPCRPFAVARGGINLSEAAAFLCLERAGAPSALAEVRGFGLSSDASHMTAPHPEGAGCRIAIDKALAMSGVASDHISWIHAHGTGSLHNDLAETSAILAAFAEAPPVSSTKGAHGHALGAAGALESVLVCAALRHGSALPSWGSRPLDPALKLRLVDPGARVPLRFVLKNTLAFGGSNCSLVFAKAGA